MMQNKSLDVVVKAFNFVHFVAQDDKCSVFCVKLNRKLKLSILKEFTLNNKKD